MIIQTQPYRRGPRELGMALQAMLLGRQPGMLNPGDFARQRAQMGAGGPVATINPPHPDLTPMPQGGPRFEGQMTPGGSPTLEQLVQQLLRRRRPQQPMMGPPPDAVGPRY